MDRIRIQGAREHNLQGVDLELPRNALIVVTGVSGSGKSSLAFDTLFREGQTRYLESFSSYARLFLGKLHRPALESVSGLSPAVAVDQRRVLANPRSTVGTMSGLQDHLRLLFARLGTPHCPGCGAGLEPTAPEALAERLRVLHAGARVLAPLVDGHKGAYRAELAALARGGHEAVVIDGERVPLAPPPELDPARRHSIALDLGLLSAEPEAARVLVERALELGKGALLIRRGETLERHAPACACPACGSGVPRQGPRLFSFNSPYGACPACQGLGVADRIDPALLVADPNLSLRQGALVPTTPSGYIVYSQVTMEVLDQVCRAHGFSVDVPWRELSEESRSVVFHGSDRLRIPFGKHPLESRLRWSGITPKPREEGFYKGIVPVLEEILKRSRNPGVLRFVRTLPCPECGGSRLNRAARSVTFRGRTIAELAGLGLSELEAWLGGIELEPAEEPAGRPLLHALGRRLRRMVGLGLGHLAADRESTTLSGGEGQRIRLAAQADVGLSEQLMVLDEPSIGLHPKDQEALLATLRELVEAGNTVLVVEHEEAIIRSADWIVDVGPGPGKAGGRILYSGPPGPLLSGPELPGSATQAYLTGRKRIPLPASRRPGTGEELVLTGAAARNLREVAARFKVGALNAVTGVSGAGKSTLVHAVLAPALRGLPGGAYRSLTGAGALGRVVQIDQAPIGRTPRSNPATYTGLFDEIRTLFAATPAAVAAGIGKGGFSFNKQGGRCEQCQGAGVLTLGMHSVEDVELTCPLCDGARFRPEVLEVRWRGLNIKTALDLTVAQARELFADTPRAARILALLAELGLGYLALGQPSTTLSGGEAQRLKLATELAQDRRERTLYILDEPSIGLHVADLRLLLEALDRLVDQGHTVLMIEHDLEAIKRADHVVDLGPGSGAEGGRVVAAGTPEELAACPESLTGRALAPLLAGAEVLPSAPRETRPIPPERIEIRGVTTNNLAGFDLDLPRNKIIAITGVSGSGKSSLAFDTLHAEGAARYAENLSTYARRFFGRPGRGRADRIRGLTPPIAIEARSRSTNPRSSVATAAHVHDSLRLLYSRAGRGADPPLSAAAFSWTRREGACPACAGLGHILAPDPEKLITHPERSILGGALDGTRTGRSYGDPRGRHMAILEAAAAAQAIDLAGPWAALGPEARALVIDGTGERIYGVRWRFKRGRREGVHELKAPWEGLIAYIQAEYERKRADARGAALEPLLSRAACAACGGSRLAPASRSVTFAGLDLAALSALTVSEAALFLRDCRERLAPRERAVSAEPLAQALSRLAALGQLGLGHLRLDRSVITLSGGETQRLRLAAALGGGLSGITYLLDEPSAGLHPGDRERLMAVLVRLRDEGNTVILVEHDLDMIRGADLVVELGPGAGPAGGRLLASCPPAALALRADSPTGRWLAGRERIPARPLPGPPGPTFALTRVRARNLKGFDLALSAGMLTVVTGVSGAGKSTLALEVVAPSVAERRPRGCAAVAGAEAFSAVARVDQDPPQAAVASLPAAFLGLIDPLRALLAGTPEAVGAGRGKSWFSLAVKGGRCEACRGLGRVKAGLEFLGESWTPCPECGGGRYGAEARRYRWRGRSAPELLDLTALEALALCEGEARLTGPLAALVETGLGYLRLGQGGDTLSGGEWQRLRLAAALADTAGRRLFVLDEPSRGLHPADLARLAAILERLAAEGHAVLLVEHRLELIERADRILELGPGGGPEGGFLLADRVRNR